MRKRAFVTVLGVGLLAVAGVLSDAGQEEGPPLGLPPVPIPEDNPQTPEKIALGEKLYMETRFSTTGEVGCFTCHDPEKAFTDSPLKTSEGINKLTGTRNAPTVINAAYFDKQFWDGRSPSLEDQSQHPFVNPIEMGLPNHEPILKIVKSDAAYVELFRQAFNVEPAAITMDHVMKAIASFERTVVGGDSPFDKWYFGKDKGAMSEAAVRGFQVFLADGRCVSCHTIEQDHALFTDNRFHNIGVGINRIQDRVGEIAPAFLRRKAEGIDVDRTVLSDSASSELGRFAVTARLATEGVA